ncbi:hypothetical protein IC006_2164 [Sulfuracidifex tepidarius]|uniref:Uncharacterized protein n=1 Tax=Sulfuracidifex tepidarius TaxID=1294262 RepID=A0A510E532_9CREN|nr:hypothetical protein IC006_2164 [Sulfuracidifex tepidarius]BBG27614.1 hypothetical protein IC007_2168 [Sulfuracidifex tepidarius]
MSSIPTFKFWDKNFTNSSSLTQLGTEGKYVTSESLDK